MFRMDECIEDKECCDMFWMSVERIRYAVVCSGVSRG
jgi:hypothetical protein